MKEKNRLFLGEYDLMTYMFQIQIDRYFNFLVIRHRLLNNFSDTITATLEHKHIKPGKH